MEEQQEDDRLDEMEKTTDDGTFIETQDAVAKVFIVGGGSGGHITPLLAVASALKEINPQIYVGLVGQKNEGLQEIIDQGQIDKVFEISAGKFRRYHGESFISHLFDIKTVLLNIRDLFRFLIGSAESVSLLARQKPDVILLKGGFVSVPIGFAASLLKIPYITHDSDVVPGLANRLTARHAVVNATAMDASLYPYDPRKTIEIGIPLRSEFTFVGPVEQNTFKTELQIDTKDRVLLCTGGGLGAQKLNHSFIAICSDVLSTYTDVEVIHLTGHSLFEDTKRLYRESLSEELYNRVRVMDFYADMYRLSGAADLVVSRAGATAIAEFAVQSKACILVPNPVLTGGQQLHNAQVLKKKDAAVIVPEDDSEALLNAVTLLLDSDEKRVGYAQRLHVAVAHEDAAKRMAELLLSQKK